MLYLTCTTITSIDLAHYGVSRAQDWVSVKCGTIIFIIILAGVLSTAFNEIDYEAFPNPATYTLTIALGDTKSDITETIDISFTNQNEPPRFTKDYFDITVTEDVVRAVH